VKLVVNSSDTTYVSRRVLTRKLVASRTSLAVALACCRRLGPVKASADDATTMVSPHGAMTQLH
jgi:hypothetical protein